MKIIFPLALFLLGFGCCAMADEPVWSPYGPDKPGYHGLLLVDNIDPDQRVLTLKTYTNTAEGEYKLFSCFVDENTKIEKRGQQIDFLDLKEGDLVYADSILYDDAAVSCGAMQLVDKDQGQGKKLDELDSGRDKVLIGPGPGPKPKADNQDQDGVISDNEADAKQ